MSKQLSVATRGKRSPLTIFLECRAHFWRCREVVHSKRAILIFRIKIHARRNSAKLKIVLSSLLHVPCSTIESSGTIFTALINTMDESKDRYDDSKILIAVLSHGVVPRYLRGSGRLTVAFNLFRRIQFYECLLSTRLPSHCISQQIHTGHRLLPAFYYPPSHRRHYFRRSKRIQVDARFSLLIKPALARTSGEGILRVVMYIISASAGGFEGGF